MAFRYTDISPELREIINDFAVADDSSPAPAILAALAPTEYHSEIRRKYPIQATVTPENERNFMELPYARRFAVQNMKLISTNEHKVTLRSNSILMKNSLGTIIVDQRKVDRPCVRLAITLLTASESPRRLIVRLKSPGSNIANMVQINNCRLATGVAGVMAGESSPEKGETWVFESATYNGILKMRSSGGSPISLYGSDRRLALESATRED